MAVAIVIIRSRNDKAVKNVPRKEKSTDPASVNRERGFDRRANLVRYSKHAICRMACRQISKVEIDDLMNDGKINYKKSDLKNERCPRYAIEGRTSDDQRVRIIFAQCNDSTTVVTVIDLDTEFSCNCPGDNKK